MKKLLITALFVGFATAAFAGTRLEMKPNAADQETARQRAYDKALHDHPKTEPISNRELKVAITTDQIMRSCCRPPDLVVSGKVTNVSPQPVNYVRFLFAFEDEDGKVLHAESVYNRAAESLSDDEQVQAILKEKPHFTPIPPGGTDTFTMVIPVILLPRFAKVELYSNPILR
jgi:hypothetical protein